MRRAVGVAALALAAAWLCLALRPRGPSTAATRTFPLPFAPVTALTLRNGEIFAIDGERHLLVRLDGADGRLKGARSFTGPVEGGLAWGKGFFWSADPAGGALYQHNNDFDSSLRRVYRIQGRNASAVYWEGSSLWLADSAAGTVTKYAVGDDASPLARYPLPGLRPAGIMVAKNLLWVCDAKSRTVYRFSLGKTLGALDRLDLDSRLPQGAAVTGFAADNSYLWVATAEPAEVRRIPWKDLKWSAPQTYSGAAKQ
jgi:hypothetical protein